MFAVNINTFVKAIWRRHYFFGLKKLWFVHKSLQLVYVIVSVSIVIETSLLQSSFNDFISRFAGDDEDSMSSCLNLKQLRDVFVG